MTPTYTLNLFDILPGKEAMYRKYSVEAGRIIFALGGKVLCSGWHPTTLRGEETRSYLIVVEFPTLEAVHQFLYKPEHAAVHKLREDSTDNYIWKIMEPWDLKTWVAFPSLK